MLTDRLQKLIEPLVESLGYELVLLEFGPHGASARLVLYIDAAGGIGLEDCERVSREVAALLDVEDPIPQHFDLEVSSPGLDRPLVKPAHFERYAGESVKLQLLVPRPNGQRRLSGQLLGLFGDAIRVRTDQGDLNVNLSDIERARLVPKF